MHYKGPGTSHSRFTRLLMALIDKFPTSVPLQFSSSLLPEEIILKDIDIDRKNREEEVQRLRTALESAIIALDSWTCTYAPEFCDEKYVEEAQQRIAYGGGPLAYIADTVSECKNALKGKNENAQV